MTTKPDSSGASAAESERAQALYRRDSQHLHSSVDRMFLWLLLVEWGLGILLASAISPFAWTGANRHLHVHLKLAILLGGVINAFPIWLIFKQPGSKLTRYSISIAQGLWSGLFIHLTGGRIETHFHIFGSLAMLAFYRDWKTLVPATLVVVFDHLLRGIYLPLSIYGQTSVEQWRFLEHAAWIVFEDTFLVVATLRGDAELRMSAWREAKLESTNAQLETARAEVEVRVIARTAEAERATRQYKAVLQASNTVPWEMNLEGGGTFTYIAPQVTRFSGWPVERYYEPGFLMTCVHPEDRKALRNAFVHSAVDTEGATEYRFRCLDGHYATVVGQFRHELEPNGSHVFRGVSVDLTKQRALEMELRQAQKLESVGRLAAGVAHEINTPVQFVSDSVHFIQDAVGDLFPLLQKYRALEASVVAGNATQEQAAEISEERERADLDYLAEQVPRAVDRSIEGLGRVANIVRSMKEFAHPDQKEKVNVDLNRAIESTLTIARSEYKLVADVETRLGKIPEVLCFPGEINQVLLNIIINAAHAIEGVVKGSETKGLIRVETAHEGDAVVVSISDTGGGIPLEIREQIFDPFFTTKEVGRGSGQGLAIARSVVQEKHGGRLTFTSELGIGTTFSIRLPIGAQQVAAF